MDKLRKVKWVNGIKYYLDGKEIEDCDIYRLADDESKRVEVVNGYEYGYFHKWTTFYRYTAYESCDTEELALIELMDGTLKYMQPKDIVFVDRLKQE